MEIYLFINLLIIPQDLKHYDFYYWFAFPALNLKENIDVISINPITSKYNETEVSLFHFKFFHKFCLFTFFYKFFS